MTAATLQPSTATTTAGRALSRLTVRQLRRSTALVALTAGGLTAVVAAQYQATFADALDSEAMRALTENPAVRVLFGAARALDDPGGFTVWRTGTPVFVLCGLWALLAATRLTRGEEDSGRWDLLPAGRARLLDLVTRSAITLTLAATAIAAAVGIALTATGTDTTGALVHALCVFGATTAFAGTGLFTAQLLPSRSAATGLASAVLGVGLLLRMLADGVSALSWLTWFTPFGLAARAAPYASNHLPPVLILIGAAAVSVLVALATARRRDLGAAVIQVPDRRPACTRLLGSVTGCAARRALAPTTGWAVGIAAYFLVIGAVITSILEFLTDNPRFAELAATAGFGGLGSAPGFAAAMFALLAIPAGLYAATRIAAVAADEKARRSTILHSLPLSRYQLAGAEIAVTTTGIALLLATAAGGLWAGAAITGAPLGLGQALAGAFNIAPVALLALGAAVLALGWYPNAVSALGALPVAGGFLLDVIARSAGAPAWVLQITLFAHLAPVPDTTPNLGATLVLIAIALALTMAGLYGYTRRDLDN
ncbi:polyketide antibiotic transporter [Nocardia rhamnosiphila]|uniref:polyketide antibiotic transporter n=1 Tax=Nocardia rhamnosiphila TaxID=426716 RepID=UPI0033C3CA23